MKVYLWIMMSVLIFVVPAMAQVAGKTCESELTKTNPQIAITKILAAADIQIGGSRPQDITVLDPAFYARVLSDPRFQLGQTYMEGMWTSPSVDQVLSRIMSEQLRNGQAKTLSPLWRTPGFAALAALKDGYRYLRDRFTNRQTRTRSTTVAKEHYDAGNELYRRMLDPTLSYTSGIWAEGYTLEDSQNAKYDLIARKMGLKPGQHVLDIGCGFGGFARFAAKHYGAKVTGITISVEQLKAARELSKEFEDVDFIYSDYRDIPNRFAANTFDHVVSIEMIEAVGIQNLEGYFKAAHASLKDGGRFVIQSIASRNDVVNSNPWFSEYIFKDGVAPSANQMNRAAQSTFGPPFDRQRITADYDKTLMAWHENFTRAWPELKADYNERFKRMWDFYLLSVAGGFRSNYMLLDQVVFVKGNHRDEAVPVRELPSRQDLDAMRASAQQIAMIEKQIGALEEDKRAMNAALAPRPTHAPVPLAKDARVAVVGAGPSGLSAARELRRLGYTNVVVFEKEDEPGGKSHTVDIAGRPHDLGATMGVRLKYSEIIKLADEQGQPTIDFPKQIHYDLQTGAAIPKPSLGQYASLAYQGLLYLVHHARMSGSDGRGLEVPPEELANPWSVVMNHIGAPDLGAKMNTYLIGYGYGGPQTPAVFAERMLDVNAIVGAAISKPIMWQNGTQPIWKGVARSLGVRAGTEINRIERTATGVRLYINGATQPEVFDKLILAVDPKTALRVLDSTPEEESVFAHVQYMPYATFAVRIEGFAEGRSEVGYLDENMTLEREGHPMAWIKRYSDDNVFVFHLFAPERFSDEQIMANTSQDMRRLGATKLTLVDSRRWPFFPHVDADAMRVGRFYERAFNLQGQNHTVFVNEAMGMSTMPDSAAQGKNAAQRLATGEY